MRCYTCVAWRGLRVYASRVRVHDPMMRDSSVCEVMLSCYLYFWMSLFITFMFIWLTSSLPVLSFCCWIYDMLAVPAFLVLPLAVCARTVSSCHWNSDNLKLRATDACNYVVIMKPQNIIDTVLDDLDSVLQTLTNVKPKHNYKNRMFRGFAASLSDSQLDSLRSNPKVSPTPSSLPHYWPSHRCLHRRRRH